MDNNKPKFEGLSITLWEKEGRKGKFILSHRGGLTEDQIAELHKLKPGDQLVVYVNDRKGETSPSHTLRQFVQRDDRGQGGL